MSCKCSSRADALERELDAATEIGARLRKELEQAQTIGLDAGQKLTQMAWENEKLRADLALMSDVLQRARETSNRDLESKRAVEKELRVLQAQYSRLEAQAEEFCKIIESGAIHARTPEEIATGMRTLSSEPTTCPTCKGTGFKSTIGRRVQCPDCHHPEPKATRALQADVLSDNTKFGDC